MRFIDEATIQVESGKGGDGCIAFRREKFIPLGGPAGGDGGRGGDVIVKADPRLSTLYDLQHRRIWRAQAGEPGRGKDQYGKNGASVHLRVPLGTQVYNAETGELLADLREAGQQIVAARGGRGGRGNIHFATSTDQAPRRAESGRPGEKRELALELKLLADIGLLGLPNVGKSTFLARVSKARAKAADYPFTTTEPQLGVVSRGTGRNFVVADLPGLIEGASAGAGMGLRFLRHLERTRLLFHLVTVDPLSKRDPIDDYCVLMQELRAFDAELAERPSVVGLSRCDLPEVAAEQAAVARFFEGQGIHCVAFSSATGEGIEKILDILENSLNRLS